MLFTFTAFLVVIGICVVSHEGGHFLAAKWRNVYVHEFSFGMGPLIVSKQKGETKYSLRAFPVGGYVKLEGEDESPEAQNSEIPRERALYAKKPWERLVILAAGISVNLLLAWLLFSSYLFVNGTWDLKTATVGKVMEGTPAAEIRLCSGDVIKKINNVEIKQWADISKTLRSVSDDSVELVYLRGGREICIKTNVPVSKEHGGRLLGIQPRKLRFSLIQSMSEALRFAFRMSSDIFSSLGRLLIGRNKEEISGPLGIAVMSGEAAKQGLWSFLMFLGLINLNLGLVNLLPFPALDGGRIVFAFAELVTGRKVSAKFEGAVHYAGFVLLLLFIIYVTGLDILRLVR